MYLLLIFIYINNRLNRFFKPFGYELNFRILN